MDGLRLFQSFVLLLIALLQGILSFSKHLSFVTYRRRLHKLGVSKVTQVDFLPREVVSYSKETQTPLATHQSEGELCLLFTSHVTSGEIARVTSFVLILCLTITDLHRIQTVTHQRLKGSLGSDFDNCGKGTQ